jgi:hypothetical protein
MPTCKLSEAFAWRRPGIGLLKLPLQCKIVPLRHVAFLPPRLKLMADDSNARGPLNYLAHCRHINQDVERAGASPRTSSVGSNVSLLAQYASRAGRDGFQSGSTGQASSVTVWDCGHTVASPLIVPNTFSAAAETTACQDCVLPLAHAGTFARASGMTRPQALPHPSAWAVSEPWSGRPLSTLRLSLLRKSS